LSIIHKDHGLTATAAVWRSQTSSDTIESNLKTLNVLTFAIRSRAFVGGPSKEPTNGLYGFQFSLIQRRKHRADFHGLGRRITRGVTLTHIRE
jgi:hypothetical protein